MKKLLLSLLLVLSSFGACAGGVVSTTVSEIISDTTGYFRVYLAASISGSPGCATTALQFAVDPTTQAGKNMMASLSMAMFAGKTVQFTGTGTCSLYSTVETIGLMAVVN